MAHTSNIPGYSALGGTTINNISFAKAKYHILGEDVMVGGSKDGTTAMMIATLNVLGRPFYEELRKNDVCFPPEIEEYLQERFRVEERNEKIEEILNKEKNEER